MIKNNGLLCVSRYRSKYRYQVIQRKEPLITPEEGVGDQRRLEREMKCMLWAAIKYMGYIKSSVLSLQVGRERDLQSKVRMPSAFLEILPQVKVSGLLCVLQRKLFPHCAYL